MPEQQDIVNDTRTKWINDFTVAFDKQGWDVHYLKRTSNQTEDKIGSLVCIERTGGFRYTIEFVRRLLLTPRRMATIITCHNPYAARSVTLHLQTEETITKVVEYALNTHQKEKDKNDRFKANQRRKEAAEQALAAELNGLAIPKWIGLRPNVSEDGDLTHAAYPHTFTDGPLDSLEPLQVRALIEFSNLLRDNLPLPVWHAVAKHPVPAKLHSTAMDYKPILLAIPGQETPVRGRYVGTLDEFFMDGSPSAQSVTHWMPLPELPFKPFSQTNYAQEN
jgi:hypothetical protein